jgi:ABC-type polysaccharide/polyol phosphate export permease
MLNDVLPYHRYIRQNAVRDIRHRYAGTGLGWFWHVVSPVMQIAIYYYVFSKKMHIVFDLPGVENGAFALYLCAGMLPWVSFAEAVIRGTGAFQENASYLKKLPIPGPVFVATTAMTATIQLTITLTLLFLLAIVLGLKPMLTWLLVPVVCVMWQIMGFGLGLLFGTLNVFFRDIIQMLIVFVQIWMWSVPVVYLESDFQIWAVVNPPFAFVHSLHELFLWGRLPSAPVWVAMIIWPTIAATAGLFAYRRLQGELRDVL